MHRLDSEVLGYTVQSDCDTLQAKVSELEAQNKALRADLQRVKLEKALMDLNMIETKKQMKSQMQLSLWEYVCSRTVHSNEIAKLKEVILNASMRKKYLIQKKKQKKRDIKSIMNRKYMVNKKPLKKRRIRGFPN